VSESQTSKLVMTESPHGVARTSVPSECTQGIHPHAAMTVVRPGRTCVRRLMLSECAEVGEALVEDGRQPRVPPANGSSHRAWLPWPARGRSQGHRIAVILSPFSGVYDVAEGAFELRRRRVI
jgi:hypothetical protein